MHKEVINLEYAAKQGIFVVEKNKFCDKACYGIFTEATDMGVAKF